MSEKEEKSVFERLNAVNVSGKTEKKNGLTYLSWAWAWGEVKKAYPTANYKVFENDMGWNYHTDGRTCWVKVSVTIEGQELTEYLPVMDYRNASIPLEKVTSYDVTRAIQRAVTKACARHGLGLYIYAGEDLPEEETAANIQEEDKPKSGKKNPGKKNQDTHAEYWENPQPAPKSYICTECGQEVTQRDKYTPEAIANWSKKNFGSIRCWECISKHAKQKQEGDTNA